MNATDNFKKTIKAYLDQRAEEDMLFSFRYSLPKKNLDDCITCILNTVQKSGCSGFEDDEIYSMAVHYYDEDDIEIGKPMNCSVVVNHTVILTEEEKAEARRQAVQKAQDEAYRKMTHPVKRAKQTVVNNMLNLFD